MTDIKTINTEKAPAAIGPYSQAKQVGELLFCSGQIPINPASGEVEASDVTGQTKQVIANIDALLHAAGYSVDQVIKTTCFLADMGDFAAFNEVYAEYFTSKPARSAVAVKTLPKNVLVEIEVIASL
ncbi:RidA family protein [Facklamia miroungae]|uniref:2-iminobutanoate/2-iminopropanoate deaminase n=1 Tax=Facklamia miroungae TaxID=120956 RepID=A0A1G7TVA3_9LACT|nr:RidA family protein [Facklamia miroungae]NKZ29986.1 RidA family protein [Facklamia miroungae]SDG39193.1 2-iminobutanoate/2-iminopropanoate deaminase [Facklamia miroungae]